MVAAHLRALRQRTPPQASQGTFVACKVCGIEMNRTQRVLHMHVDSLPSRALLLPLGFKAGAYGCCAWRIACDAAVGTGIFECKAHTFGPISPRCCQAIWPDEVCGCHRKCSQLPHMTHAWTSTCCICESCKGVQAKGLSAIWSGAISTWRRR